MKRFPVTLIFCILCFAVALFCGEQFYVASNQATKMRDAEEAGEILFISLLNAETGQRGFIITGDDAYLDPYSNNIKLISQELDNLDALIDDKPTQTKIDQLRQLTQAKIEELSKTITLRRSGFPSAQKEVDSNTGKNLMDSIRVHIDSIQRWSSQEYSKMLRKEHGNARVGFMVLLAWWISVTVLISRRNPTADGESPDNRSQGSQ